MYKNKGKRQCETECHEKNPNAPYSRFLKPYIYIFINIYNSHPHQLLTLFLLHYILQRYR